MKEVKLYYLPPDNKLFEELKIKAMALWQDKYPEETSPFYAKEKVDRIKDLQNFGDNFMYIVAMFDAPNQAKLSQKLSEEARTAIRERMLDGGTPVSLIYF